MAPFDGAIRKLIIIIPLCLLALSRNDVSFSDTVTNCSGFVVKLACRLSVLWEGSPLIMSGGSWHETICAVSPKQ